MKTLRLRRMIETVCFIALLLCIWSVALKADPYTLRPMSLALDAGTKTASAVSGAVTLNKASGVITTEALATAIGGSYVLTITDSSVTATDQVFASVSLGTATTGAPAITTTKPGAGTIVITVQNISAAAALNGTLKIAFIDLDN
jgi:hypothetical protein